MQSCRRNSRDGITVPVKRPSAGHGHRRSWTVVATAASLAMAALGLGATLTASPAAAAEATVSPVGGSWTVKGHGYGHGHGLSQWGAQSRALAGQSAQPILDFYYPGTGTAATGGRTLRDGPTPWAS